ncbi:MAG: hypothetical protein ISS70_15825 [Phycisphaerae bacterium]|nr:hypothetical protein [Phycisphaerae bacterium]
MDIPNFKDILQKLSVFKNNTALLVPVIVALVGILLFIPAQLLSGKLKAQVQKESITAGGAKVDRLRRDFSVPIQPESLDARIVAHGNDANEISDLGRQSTMRDLLSYDIFPEIDVNNFSGLIFVEFGQKFRAGIEGLIESVNGRDCPTQVEIDVGLEASSASTNRRRGMFGAGDPYSMGPAGAAGPMPRGRLGSLPGMRGPRSQIDLKIVDQMCQKRAASAFVYVNPSDIGGYDHWLDYKYDVNMVPAVKDAWYHQLAYWVTEDIFNAIAATNAGHESLLTAPVKRFQSLSFTMGLKRPGSRRTSKAVIRSLGGRRASQQKDEESDRPAYVVEDRDGLTESLTGRYSVAEGAIDVIHFSITAVVAQKDILLFMQELCSAKEHQFSGYPEGSQPPQTFKHNQITILESKIGALNPDDMLHYYYRYGDDAVVVLDLICEYIFNKAGYEPIVPQAIKDMLASLDETSGR